MSAAVHDDRYTGIFTPTASSNHTNNHGSSNDNMTMSASSSAAAVVSPGFETQTLLSTIYCPSSITEIGSNKFMVAYCINLERLSIQAHWTAGVISSLRSTAVSTTSNDDTVTTAATPGLANVLSALTGAAAGGGEDDDEYIVDAFLESVDTIEALVKTLLMLELWRDRVLFGRNGLNAAVVPISEDEEVEEVEFEIEGGDREGEDDDQAMDQCYNDLNEVDGGNQVNNIATNESINFQTTKKGVGRLAHRLAANGNVLRTAFILHAETTIVSLLNLILYKGIPAGLLEGSSGDDSFLLSLVDYCARQLIFLSSPEDSNPALSRQKNPLPSSKLSTYLQSRTRIEEIQDSIHDSTYQTAIASVTLSRYLCENVNELGPSLLSRMLEVHDFPLLMVPLVEEPPWTRRRLIEKRQQTKDTSKNNTTTRMIWEKLDDHNEWKEVPSTDLLRVTQLEGQPWLALFHITTSSICREAYGLDEYRKSQLMRLRKYIHEALLDQLPVLEATARYLDELSILGVPPSGQGVHRPSSNASSSGLLLQRVDLLRESIVGGKRGNMQDDAYWERIAQLQWEEIFSRVTDSKDEELRRIASEVYGGAGVDDDCFSGDAHPLAGPNNDIQDEKESHSTTTAEDWKVRLSKPIEKVILHMEDRSNSVLGSFELAPVKNGKSTITNTPAGPFQRLKMSISQTSCDGEAIFPHAKVVASIQLQRDPSSGDMDNNEGMLLSIDSLALPTVEHSTSQNSYDEVGIALPGETIFPSKEWRQLGELEGKSIVLQLGFKRLPRGMVPANSNLLRGYTLSQAFLSQPLVR